MSLLIRGGTVSTIRLVVTKPFPFEGMRRAVDDGGWIKARRARDLLGAPARPSVRSAADAVGVSVETVRYYERRGLLEAPQRTDAGYRIYDDRDLQRLSAMKALVAAGWSPRLAAEHLTLRACERYLAASRIARRAVLRALLR